jgi:hypothetical protein
LGIKKRGGYALESLRSEICEALKSEMNKDCQIWRTYEDRWIRAVGQQTTSARTCGRPCQHEHVPHGDPRQQGHVVQSYNDKC